MKKNSTIRFKFKNIFLADLETTTEKDKSEVWLGGVSPLDDNFTFKSVETFTSIDGLFEIVGNDNNLVYLHNLSFDGEFILAWLYKNGFVQNDITEKIDKTFDYCINGFGQWYFINVMYNGHKITIWDSYKLIPMSIADIAEKFCTTYKKDKIDYDRHNTEKEVTFDEIIYLKKDVLILKEAMFTMHDLGYKKMTIGACALNEFYSQFSYEEKKNFFPNLFDMKFDENTTVDYYIRKAYHGGYVYLNEDIKETMRGHGITLDVNSLYPFVMRYCRFPVGKPSFFKGNDIPEKLLERDEKGFFRYYTFLRVEFDNFQLKEGKLPCVKGTKSLNKWLVNGDFVDENGKEIKAKKMLNGTDKPIRKMLTLTIYDFMKFINSYEIQGLKIVDGIYFYSRYGLFDKFVDKYYNLKLTDKSTKRQIWKLLLNNLSGKFASSPINMNVRIDAEHNKDVEISVRNTVYIPIGAAITSYARLYTLECAEKNLEYLDYIDTDSLHLECNIEDVKGLTIDNDKLGAWKFESEWETAKFLKLKLYMEKDKKEGWVVKAAGLSKRAKDIFQNDLRNGNVNIDDVKKGYTINGNMKKVIVDGGAILEEEEYRI